MKTDGSSYPNPWSSEVFKFDEVRKKFTKGKIASLIMMEIDYHTQGRGPVARGGRLKVAWIADETL